MMNGDRPAAPESFNMDLGPACCVSCSTGSMTVRTPKVSVTTSVVTCDSVPTSVAVAHEAGQHCGDAGFAGLRRQRRIRRAACLCYCVRRGQRGAVHDAAREARPDGPPGRVLRRVRGRVAAIG